MRVHDVWHSKNVTAAARISPHRCISSSLHYTFNQSFRSRNWTTGLLRMIAFSSATVHISHISYRLRGRTLWGCTVGVCLATQVASAPMNMGGDKSPWFQRSASGPAHATSSRRLTRVPPETAVSEWPELCETKGAVIGS
jgi:hypothetical protein